MDKSGGVHWVQSVHRAWLERSRSMRRPFSLARWKQRLNPLHAVILRLERKHFEARRYRRIIATTPIVRTDLNRLYGVPESDVEIIPNGFAPEEFNPRRREENRPTIRQRLGLRPDQIALLFAANELDRKGYPTILAAMRELNCPDLRLLVVGRTDMKRVRQLASDAGVGSQVIACGPTSEIWAYHAAADLFVLPTQYEAFSLAIIESLGSGLPVVTSRVPGAGDAIIDGVNGALVSDPRDGSELASVLRPLLDPDRRLAITRQTADTVREYQWPVLLARYEQILLQNCN